MRPRAFAVFIKVESRFSCGHALLLLLFFRVDYLSLPATVNLIRRATQRLRVCVGGYTVLDTRFLGRRLGALGCRIALILSAGAAGGTRDYV